LRDVTPRRLETKVGAGRTAPKAITGGTKLPPPHLSGDDEEWEEF